VTRHGASVPRRHPGAVVAAHRGLRGRLGLVRTGGDVAGTTSRRPRTWVRRSFEREPRRPSRPRRPRRCHLLPDRLDEGAGRRPWTVQGAETRSGVGRARLERSADRPRSGRARAAATRARRPRWRRCAGGLGRPCRDLRAVGRDGAAQPASDPAADGRALGRSGASRAGAQGLHEPRFRIVGTVVLVIALWLGWLSTPIRAVVSSVRSAAGF